MLLMFLQTPNKKTNINLPASSEVPTRHGLLAVITSEHSLSKSREVNRHSSPPEQITLFKYHEVSQLKHLQSMQTQSKIFKASIAIC